MNNGKFVEKVKETQTRLKIPGVAAGVLQEDETFTMGSGVTNVDHPLAVDDLTLFQIGSITKTFVGTLAMRLVEMGKLDLDAPIRTYMPEFKVADEEAAANVTMRHLFTHTAGWVGDWFPTGMGHGEEAVSRYVASMADTPQLTPLGEVLSYNNAGFNVAGRIFEVLLSKPFTEIMQEMLFDPLKMTHTYLLPWDLMTYRFVSGHVEKEGRTVVARPWSIGRASGPAGGIVTNVKDMLHYACFQLGDGTFNGARLLEPESLEQLHTPQVEFTPFNSVALTFWIDNKRESRTMGHGGGTVGQISLLTLVPDYNFGLLLVTNSDTGRQFTPEVTNWALEHYLGVQTRDPPLLEIPQETLLEYAGSYEATLTATEVTVTKAGLTISQRRKGGFPSEDIPPAVPEPTPPAQFGFYDKDHVIGLEAPFKGDLGQFLRNPDGNIAWFRFGLRIHRPV